MSVHLPESLNIADAFLENRLREGRGERVALRLADRQVTYSQVSELAARFGQVLLGLGVRNLTGEEYSTRGFGSSSVIPAPGFGAYGGFNTDSDLRAHEVQ